MTHAISRRSVVHGLCGCTGLALAGCVSNPEPAAPITNSYRPASNTLEGGIWKSMERLEKENKTSPLRVVEPGLNKYVSEMACDLAKDACPNIRVYIVETPQFNAFMAPTGMMQIWSGLLLRCRNEAELAAIVGHEIGHFVHRHSLQQLQNASNQLAFANFAGIILSGLTGANFLNLTQMIALANIFAFSRDQENEADDFGFKAMADAGYNPMAAADIWRGVVKEEETDLDEDELDRLQERRTVWTASHPAPRGRITRAMTAASTLDSGRGVYRAAEYQDKLAPLRDAFMEAEIRLRQPSRTLVLINRLNESFPDDPAILYYRGEVYRRRGKTGDMRRAFDAYGEAVVKNPAYARAWRGIGILHRRQNNHVKAAEAFRKYLQFDPNASDRLMIQSYLGAQS